MGGRPSSGGSAWMRARVSGAPEWAGLGVAASGGEDGSARAIARRTACMAASMRARTVSGKEVRT